MTRDQALLKIREGMEALGWTAVAPFQLEDNPDPNDLQGVLLGTKEWLATALGEMGFELMDAEPKAKKPTKGRKLKILKK